MLTTLPCLILALYLGVSSFNSTPYSYKSNSDYNDCSSAITICELKDYHFKPESGFGALENLNIEEKNFRETNSLWLKLDILKGSTLEFTIIPDNENDDYDFVVYQSEVISCKNLMPIREIMSGRVIGQNIECLGLTGILRGHTDFRESKGCNNSKDNYGAPIDLLDNISYYILVNNYNSSDGFTIVFEKNESIILKDNCKSDNTDFDFSIYPNPTSGVLSLIPTGSLNSDVQIEIIDVLGRILYRSIEENFNRTIQKEISFLPASQYYVRITKEQDVRIKPFLKN